METVVRPPSRRLSSLFSQNQQVHFRSDVYDETVLTEQTEVEFHVLPTGEIQIVGYADNDLAMLVEGML